MTSDVLRADIGLIQRIIPHRYPFLLVDRVEDIVGTQSARGIKKPSASDSKLLPC